MNLHSVSSTCVHGGWWCGVVLHVLLDIDVTSITGTSPFQRLRVRVILFFYVYLTRDIADRYSFRLVLIDVLSYSESL